MTSLPTVTVIAATSINYGQTILALKKTLDHIEPYQTIYFSDVPYLEDDRIHHVQIERFKTVDDYSWFIMKMLADYVKSEHILIIQYDGYVIDGTAWRDEFLSYDYIGAPWGYKDGRNVGNGGFSLRSRKLQKLLQSQEFEFFSPEDEKICRYYRQTLEKYGIIFAPEELAHRFSFEMHRPTSKTFGFHNYFHPPYKEPIILQRAGAMGDIIMMEPVMAWFYDHGYRVVLDCPKNFYNLFAKHYFPIEHITDLNEDTSAWRVINLDMAYEVTPKELVLQAYYNTCGITDGVLRNSKLNFNVPADKQEVKLFDKYVILHIDDTAVLHRNVHGVDWEEVAAYIQVFLGYPVFRVGRGNGRGGQKIQTFSENMLAYIVANADYFIGIDSGVAQIAVACDVPSMVFFGSVMANKRYVNFEKIKVMQKMCPILKDGCYHSEISVVGIDCEVDVQHPPCIGWTTKEIQEAVKQFVV